MDAQARPVFLYEFNSPYAYLAAARVDEVLAVRPRWQPVAFAFMLRAHRREPWSFDESVRVHGSRSASGARTSPPSHATSSTASGSRISMTRSPSPTKSAWTLTRSNGEVVSDEVKDRLTEATGTALAAGAVGVPAVLAAGQSFWGDDQLEAAAAAIAGSQP